MAAPAYLRLVKGDGSGTGTGVDTQEAPIGRLFQITPAVEPSVDARTSRPTLDASALYRNLAPEDGRVIQALGLIGRCTGHIEAASTIDARRDFIGYDEELIRAKDSLRKLFALRDIGDGFAAVINAVLCAIANCEERVLSAKQFSSLLSVLRQLRKKPMMHFDSATPLLDELEDSDLDIEPPFIGALTGFLDE